MTQRPRSFFWISLMAFAAAFVVVVLGAYTRLSESGLGCPDWPGCYGAMVVPEDAADVAQANAAFPERPLDHDKAWTEMVHRYAAGGLGLLILAAAVIGWHYRRVTGQPWRLPLVLVVLVLFQAVLGMWTVTWLLKPAVVVAHLMGGMTILALLFWLVLTQLFHAPAVPGSREDLMPWVVAGVVVLAIQIFLGGWTSANYAAFVCPEFPTCRAGDWWPPADFREAFVFWRGVGTDYQGGVLDQGARIAIQLAHRAGALVTVLVVGAVAVRALLATDPRARFFGGLLLLLVVVQVGLGVVNVMLILPLPAAVAHNANAALLLLGLVALLHHAAVTRY